MIQRSFYILIFCIISLIFSSCEWDELEVSNDPNFRLDFSVDTVFFDTLYTSIDNIQRINQTERFLIYNRTNSAVEIDKIELDDANDTYMMVVNGITGNQQEKVFLGQNDSILILVDANIPFEDTDQILEKKGSISFLTNGQEQRVILSSWANNPIYHQNEIINTNSTWQKGRDHLIVDSLTVAEGISLSIEAGALIFFDQQAKLIVNGSISAIGSCSDSIIFNASENPSPENDIPGFWDGLSIGANSTNNQFSHCLILNARTGINALSEQLNSTDTLFIENCTVSHMSLQGVSSTNRNIVMRNSVVNNTLAEAIYASGDGILKMTHNTIDNSFSSFIRVAATVNLEESTGSLSMANNIVWGDFDEELLFGSTLDVIQLTGNLLKTTDLTRENGNILNENPKFSNISIQKNVYFLSEDSPCIDAGNIANKIAFDLSCFERDDNPDIGALEYREPIDE